jgi:hypothetical protein
MRLTWEEKDGLVIVEWLMPNGRPMVMMGGDLLPLLLKNLAGVWVEGVFA